MIPYSDKTKLDLVDIAKRLMKEKGLATSLPEDAASQLNSITGPASCTVTSIKEMSNKLWFSIDNDDSRDLDQLTYAEPINEHLVRIFVAIADVDVLVPKNSPLDIHAESNTTSVYTPMVIFPMLPEKLSTNFTSLNPNEKRMALIVQMDINDSGEIISYDVLHGCVFNYAKLAYNSVGDWLENPVRAPRFSLEIENLDAQIRLQDQVAQRIKKRRIEAGSLSFETYDPQPIIKNGQVVDIQEVKINRARELIENFMIAANTSITLFLKKNHYPVVQRVVRIPKRWNRIVELASTHHFNLPLQPDSKALETFLLKMKQENPQGFPDLSLLIIKLLGRGEYVVTDANQEPLGHFALALSSYTHATAPNRRYPDLIVQRLIKSIITGQTSPYPFEQLQIMMLECTEKEARADKVKRSAVKSMIASFLEASVGQLFDALITGKGEKGTWVRLMNTAIEGKLVQGEEQIDVGDQIQVKLIAVNVEKGFIDFILVKIINKYNRPLAN